MPEIPYVSEITIATRGLSLPSFAYSPPSYTDSECINYIRYLPENVMMYEHGIYLSATDLEELTFMRALLKNYHYLADWLEYFILKDSKKMNLLYSEKGLTLKTNYGGGSSFGEITEGHLDRWRKYEKVEVFQEILEDKSLKRYWSQISGL